MPNWKKILTSGSNIQISELTLDAAGVHKASIDTSGNIAAEGAISSSGVATLTGLVIQNNGVNSLTLHGSGTVSASSPITSTAFTAQTNGATKATIDASGNIAAEGAISSSGTLSGDRLTLATNGVNALTVSTAGALSASSTLAGTALTLGDDGINSLTVDTKGHISASGTGSFVSLNITDAGVAKFNVDTNGHVSASGDISSSATLLGTDLDLRTAGTQKAAITADGSASFAGGIDTFHDATASLGYITASQLIIQGTDQSAAISLFDNDGNNIAAFARCGSGVNAHKGRLVLRDNADTKIELTPIGTSYVMGAFSSSGTITANSFTQTSNGTTLASISNQGVINAGMGLISHTIGSGKGDVVYFGGTTSMTTGDIYHYKSDGTWELADCNAAANSDGLLAVALGAASDTNGMLLRGMATLAEIDGTEAVGDVLYLSEDTTGNANSVAPAGNGDIVRVIGYCLHASNKTIWFNPDSTFVEVTA